LNSEIHRLGRSRLLHATVSLAAVLSAGLLYVARVDAATSEWSARFVDQSEFLTLEGGELATSSFRAQNTGSATWDSAFVRLGTSNPRDRTSQFAVPGVWLSPNRPASLREQFVSPGAVGTFEYQVRAPSAPGRYDEAFEPIAEGRSWMGANPGWGLVFIGYQVLPREAPTIRSLTLPDSVKKGDTFRVVATATDNRGLRRIEFSLGSRTFGAQPIGEDQFAATLPSSGLGAGSQIVAVRAVDRVGQDDTGTASFQVIDSADRGSGGSEVVTETFPVPARDLPPCRRRVCVLPKPAIAASARFKTLGGRRVTTLLSVSIFNVARGTRVTLRCLERCSRPPLRRSRTVGRKTPKFARLRQTVSPHTILELRVTREGRGGRYLRFSIAADLPRKRKAGCLSVEASRPVPCIRARLG